jgi:sterol desaturase/sphingolipid hydroxylase (fatty acid hydroxylase superfamily)
MGLITYSLAGYVLHRFLYHKISNASYSKGLQYLFHGVHHTYSNNQEKIVLPPVPSILISVILYGLFYSLLGKYAFLFAPGFLMGYSFYMLIHSLVLNTAMPPRFNFWWRHHNIHHYQQHDRAFGVSSSLWDRAFGTLPEKNRKTVEVVLIKNSKEKRF